MSVTTTAARRAATAAVLMGTAALTVCAPASAAPTGDTLSAQIREGLADLHAAAGTYAQFAYPAPTFGCNGVTFTGASGTGGAVGASTSLDSLRFHAAPAYTGYATASGLQVAWLNVNNGASGVVPLDELTEYNLPALARVVQSGPGSVIAALWGTVTYPDATCYVAPTVGLFNVEFPPPPPEAVAEAEPAA